MEQESSGQIAFVFWDQNYDEVLAVTYVAQLREAGIPTKIVCLHGKRAFGTNGVLLSADYNLGEALPLAQHALCVVIPCHSPLLGHLDTDPRARIFLQRAAENGATFITGRIDSADMNLFPIPSHQVQIVINNSAAGQKAAQLGMLLAQPELP